MVVYTQDCKVHRWKDELEFAIQWCQSLGHLFGVANLTREDQCL